MALAYVDSLYRIPLPVAPGQAYSEFNHHVAGLAILLVGVSAILMEARPRMFGFLKYVWPLSLVLLGVYLIVYSDPEAWPTGRMGIAASLHDPEVLQHKVYAILLITMGLVELARTSGLAKSDRWRFSFPSLATLGAIYLIFHKHGANAHMEMPEGMPMNGDMGMHADPAVMALINYQHAGYIIIGITLVAMKTLYETRKLTGPAAPYIWPSLMSVLGLMLMFYRE